MTQMTSSDITKTSTRVHIDDIAGDDGGGDEGDDGEARLRVFCSFDGEAPQARTPIPKLVNSKKPSSLIPSPLHLEPLSLKPDPSKASTLN